jgi:hypothetical protein
MPKQHVVTRAGFYPHVRLAPKPSSLVDKTQSQALPELTALKHLGIDVDTWVTSLGLPHSSLFGDVTWTSTQLIVSLFSAG